MNGTLAAALWLVAYPAGEAAPVAPPTPPPASELPTAAPPSVADAYRAAEGLQGALDGTWRLTDAGGRLLYVFQLTDPGGGDVEGAWRDPSRAGATDGSGFLDSVRRKDQRLEIRFGGRLFAPLVVLHAADGGWTGELIHDGPRRAVTLTRAP